MAITFNDFMNVLQDATEYSRYISAVCPFHKDTNPSLLVFRDGWFQCLGCNKRGTWKTLWNKVHGQPVQVTTSKQISWATPQLEGTSLEDACYQAYDNLLRFPSNGWYLENRGIENRIEINQLGYWNGWYTFPVFDEEFEFQTAVFRASPPVQEVTGQRYWSKGVPTMYVPDWNKVYREDYIYVTFGMIDALVVAELGLPVVTSTSGKDSFNPEWLDEFRKEIIIVPDKGEDVNIKSGSVTEGTAWKLARRLGWRGKVLSLPYPDDIKDPADYFAKGKRKELLALLAR